MHQNVYLKKKIIDVLLLTSIISNILFCSLVYIIFIFLENAISQFSLQKLNFTVLFKKKEDNKCSTERLLMWKMNETYIRAQFTQESTLVVGNFIRRTPLS